MKDYTEFHFVLVLSQVSESTPGLEDALFEAGCDDALIIYRNGVVSLTFDRHAENLEKAITSAIRDIESTSLHARVDHVEGAFVTLTDIAQKSGFTKQAISLFIRGKRGAGYFPVPFAGVNSTSPIWRWRDVLQWLSDQQKLNDKQLLENAAVIDGINMALQVRSYKTLKKYTDIIQNI